MYKLKSSDQYNVTGRGKIMVVNKLDSPDVKKLKVGDRAEINGTVYEVKGIEKSWKPMYLPIEGDNFGLVVKECDDK
jgi:hypothetical protein